MNKFDFVEIINLKEEYRAYNLYLHAKGFVIENYDWSSKILFFNEYNQGDYAFVEIFNEDLKPTEEQPPKQLIDLIKNNLQNFTLKEKGLKPKLFKIYERVELIVEDAKYTKFNIHKGNTGTIMEDVAIQDYLLVDFGRLDENNNYHGDCISVKMEHLKHIE